MAGVPLVDPLQMAWDLHGLGGADGLEAADSLLSAIRMGWGMSDKVLGLRRTSAAVGSGIISILDETRDSAAVEQSLATPPHAITVERFLL